MTAWSPWIRGVASLVAAGLLVASCSSPTTTETTIPATTIAPTTTTSPAATSSAPPTTTTLPSSATQEQLTAFVDDVADDLSHGGVVAAVIRNGEVTAASAGSQPDGSAVPADPLLRIGSVTKPFVATLTLLHVEDGLIDLDTPADVYVPELGVPTSVTVRDLLQHTSGIFNYTEDIAFFPETVTDLDRRWDPAELAQHALELREVPEDPPWSYSNTNYLILGLINETVTGATLDSQLADRIFTPLGLSSMYLDIAAGGAAPVGAFTAFPPEVMPVDETFTYTSTATGAWGAGAIVSTPSDLLGFFRSLLNGEILSDESLQEMLTTNSVGYGLGIAKISGVDVDTWGHNGLILGFTTNVAYSPVADVGVAVGVTFDRPPAGFERDLEALLEEQLSS